MFESLTMNQGSPMSVSPRGNSGIGLQPRALFQDLGKGYNPSIKLREYGIDPRIPGFHGDLDLFTQINTSYRLVFYTGEHSQMVLMHVPPGENLGLEVHPDNDQFIKVEDGDGYAIINGSRVNLKAGSAVAIPAGTQHDIISTTGLKLYTIYSPPHHPYDRVDHTKEEAEAAGH